MSGKESCDVALQSFLISTLESHVRSIRQEALTVCINHAQCELVARRLQRVYNMFSKLPDCTPSPQLLTVFASADMLVQRMRHGRWLVLLERHFTCRAMFAALFERIPCVWQLQMTDSWPREDLLAVQADERMDARIHLDKLGCVAGTGARVCRQQEDSGSSSDEEFGLGNSRTSAPGGDMDEQGVIDMFRRQALSKWRVPLENLTPPEEEAITPLYAESKHQVFSLYHGYYYRRTPVLLYQLEETPSRTISPATVTSFVQDMVTRSRWCHPNLVPFIGAFTEKVPLVPTSHEVCAPNYGPDEELSGVDSGSPRSNVSENDILEVSTTAAGCGLPDAAATPVLDLGYMIEDMRYMKAELLNKTNTHLNSYFIREVDDPSSAETFKSLHEVLFVERRPFSVKEAIAITLQVADSLQYILMDEDNVPNEVLCAWTAVSPSNIYVCPIRAPGGSEHEHCREPGASAGSTWPTCDGDYEDTEEEYDHDMSAPPFCGSSVQQRRCVELFAPGGLAALYSPPVYVDGGPYSRWAPHPHASFPTSYAMAQLFLALVNNESPYRLLTKQEDLARQVFEADRDSCHNDATVSVRVSIPVGSVVPRKLPVALRKLCSRAMHLRNPHHEGETRGGISLSDFRNEMWEMYVNASPSMETRGTISCAEEEAQMTAFPIGERVEIGLSREPSLSKERVLGPALDDYGELTREEC